MKITNFSKDLAIVRKLYENDYAFKNSEKFIIQDIPYKFHGTSVMKFNTRVDRELISFHINTPSMIYVAFLAHYPNPLRDDFENTGFKMSLLQLDDSTEKKSVKLLIIKKKQFAKKSSLLLIYKKKFPLGLVKIPLNSNGLNKKGVPLIIFFRYDPKSKSPIACSGDEKNVSSSSSPFFKECKR